MVKFWLSWDGVVCWSGGDVSMPPRTRVNGRTLNAKQKNEKAKACHQSVVPCT